MNVKLLNEIKERITREPETLNMSVWHCDTAHCIAGWAQVLVFPRNDDLMTVERDARRALRTRSRVSAFRLFHLRNWPLRFNKAYLHAESPKGRAHVTCQRIDHFIKTKGKE